MSEFKSSTKEETLIAKLQLAANENPHNNPHYTRVDYAMMLPIEL